jgi:hypothetical protein
VSTTPSSPRRVFRFALALGLASWAIGTVPARAEDDLDPALLKHAPKIIEGLHAQKVHNVGVLKFTVQKANEAPSDNAGPLNLSVPNRLEVALVLANPNEKLGIIRHASATLVEAKNKRANHLSKEGRLACFDGRYFVAWGKGMETAQADAFLTGMVELSPDLRRTTVRVLAFTQDQPELAEVARFTVPTDARTLAEVGESYALGRGAFKDGKVEVVAAVETAAEVRNNKEQVFPLKSKEAPVELEVRYDGEAVPLNVANGQAQVKEPRQGQKVTFYLHNRDKLRRYGVVLKVNGENTLYRERLDAAQCTKWILEPGEAIEVKGFQIRDGQANQFEVLPPEQSEEEEVNYGEHAGTFTVIAFVEKGGKDERPITLDDWAKRLAAVRRGELPAPEVRPARLTSLQEQLTANKDEKGEPRYTISRGLVVQGGRIKSLVQTVKFDADPTPILVSTIRYYQPRTAKKVSP